MKRFLLTFALIIGLTALSACDWDSSSSDDRDRKTVNAQQEQYAIGQPVPTFDFSLERDVYVQLYRARNQNVATYTVWRSDFGNILGDCPSIGYPIPYDSSLTNPLKKVRGNGTLTTVEQAEPNGLYSSKNSIATWIRCVQPDGSQVPVYIEDKVTAYPFPVEVDYDTDRVKQIGDPSVRISSSQ